MSLESDDGRPRERFFDCDFLMLDGCLRSWLINGEDSCDDDEESDAWISVVELSCDCNLHS